jgi:NADPH:quinone reductase-like Zn-dependent oxidoreductase
MTVEQPMARETAHRPAPTMRALVRDTYGSADDVLRLAETPMPEIGDDEVLLRVHAAGVDRGLWHVMTGLPYPIRLAGYGFRTPKNRVLGMEAAGIVEAVGRNVTSVRPGDEVYGAAEGSLAEYARARADRIAPKPRTLTFEQAAAAPVSALAALQAVRDRARVQPGQKVLVIGASGGFGSFAVQIAKAFGAEVTGMCSTAAVDLVRSLGADHVLDRTRTEITDGGQRYDVVLDAGGHRSLRLLKRALTPRGTLVIIGSETGGRWLGGTDRQLRAIALSPFIGQRLGTFVSTTGTADLAALSELVESGAVTPVVDRVYPLGEAVAATRHMTRGARGKVVVKVAD